MSTGDLTRSTAVSAVLRRNLPSLIGLSTLIVAQPLLSVYGSNPASITAAKLSAAEFVLFGLAVVVVPPLSAAAWEVAVVSIAPRWLTPVHRLTVGAFGLTLGLYLAKQAGLGPTVPTALVAAGAAVALAALVTSVAGVATATRYCALAAPLVLGLLLASPAGAAAFSAGAEPIDLDLVDPPSVVTVVFDEFHLPSLLDADGRVNAERYPNFARLAARSTWHRNASSPLARTPEAMTAFLSGTLPEGGGQAPVASGSSIARCSPCSAPATRSACTSPSPTCAATPAGRSWPNPGSTPAV